MYAATTLALLVGITAAGCGAPTEEAPEKPRPTEASLPSAGTVVATIPLDGGAQGVAEVGGAVWVGMHHGGGIVPIDPVTNSAGELAETGNRPGSLVADESSLWVSNYGTGPESASITKVDPGKGKVVVRVSAPDLPDLCCDPGLGGGRLWVTTAGAGRLVGIDVQTGAVTANHAVEGGFIEGAVFAEGLVWVADGEGTDTTVMGIDPESGEVVHTVELGYAGAPVAADGTTVWGLSVVDVFAIDAETGSIAGRVPVDVSHGSLTFGLGSVWVAGGGGSSARGVLYRVDPAARKVIGRTALDVIPSRVFAGSDSVWVSSFEDDAVVRIDPA